MGSLSRLRRVLNPPKSLHSLPPSSHNDDVGFVLWMGPDVAWAAGTYEYRAMGAAVISNTDLFRHADFRRGRRPPPSSSPWFVGQFASIGQVNAYLLAKRRRRRRSSARLS
jgi:hypothetical protein